MLKTSSKEDVFLLTLEFLTQNLVGQFRVGLAAGLLHQLTNKEALELVLTATESFHFFRVSSQKLFNNRGDRGRVADHAQPALIDDLGR